jgi:hypothetical protein
MNRINLTHFVAGLFFLTVSFIPASASVLNVPADYKTISEAIQHAESQDTILVAPGIYYENLKVNKSITLASWYIKSKDESHIVETVVDGLSRTVFEVQGFESVPATIVGFSIRNGEDGIMAAAPLNLLNCRIRSCQDGIDYESGGEGICSGNVFMYNLDDGIDLDGRNPNLIIEENIIAQNVDDGIEIRLHPQKGMATHCRIANNIIANNGEDGIQFIDYEEPSNRSFTIERNVIHSNHKVGIGCMDQGETIEDYRASAVLEKISLINNTIKGHQYGITGGSNMILVNNIISHSKVSAIKNLVGNSVISHCLFFQNGLNLENPSIVPNQLLLGNPKLDANFRPTKDSPCIDQGMNLFIYKNDTLIHIPSYHYSGNAPDIGAFEFQGFTTSINDNFDSEFRVFPNPFREILHMALESNTNTSSVLMQLYDAKGSILHSEKIDAQQVSFDTSKFPAGTYFLRLGNYHSGNVVKLIKP